MADEEANGVDELDGTLAPAWLLEIVATLLDTAAKLLDLSDELLAEDTKDAEDWLPSVLGAVEAPPHAVNTADSETAEIMRKE